ncbi:MAG: bifunctional diaminohydroxyphosphoribosylaminopyrimidine deaminase/5-amino-6-(5-phosphoribosylamino)uracil reductase RibD [Gammaproteobacteria bacterium]|nr:bifunctional diaminohydroxyphosphoribosylaminopyrimidine deaminase/5-amino-6-(5-phosphoribosylamino)uracil reductase RibD [Gammaproteobacteria bacterium]
MSVFSPIDNEFMARALRLAERGKFLAKPNPKVGCVIAKNNIVVGEGYHQRFGEAHAEVNALAMAGDKAKGATAYVTLEPCAHQGKTGPCAKALISAGVSRVVMAMRDPNPKVDGGGEALLNQAGIKTESGLMEAEARQLNPGFIKRMKTGLPWIRIKLAQSSDGRTAMANGESKWITGAAARQDVQRLRARHDAIITGRGTVMDDAPSLTVRMKDWDNPPEPKLIEHYRQPLRVVLDRNASLSIDNPFFRIDSPIWWVHSKDKNFSTHSTPILDHITVKAFNHEQFLTELLSSLAKQECNEVLIEAGAELSGAFLQAGLCDELIVYQAAKLMGSLARPLTQLPIDSMNECLDLNLIDLRQIGSDLRMTYQLKEFVE